MSNQGHFHPVKERLEAKSIKRDNGCIEWTGALADTGYGILSVHGRLTSTHRASYEQANGPIPPDMCVCHRCDNRKCINPNHLFLGTKLDNTRDAINKGRLKVHGLKRGR